MKHFAVTLLLCLSVPCAFGQTRLDPCEIGFDPKTVADEINGYLAEHQRLPSWTSLMNGASSKERKLYLAYLRVRKLGDFQQMLGEDGRALVQLQMMKGRGRITTQLDPYAGSPLVARRVPITAQALNLFYEQQGRLPYSNSSGGIPEEATLASWSWAFRTRSDFKENLSPPLRKILEAWERLIDHSN